MYEDALLAFISVKLSLLITTNITVNKCIMINLCVMFSLPRMLQSLYDYPQCYFNPYKELSPVVLRSPEDPQPHRTFHSCTNIFVQRVYMRRNEFIGGRVESLSHVSFKLTENIFILLIDLLTGALFKVFVIACI